MQDRLLVFWAPSSKQVVAKQQRVLGSLVLSEQQAKADDARAIPVLLKVGSQTLLKSKYKIQAACFVCGHLICIQCIMQTRSVVCCTPKRERDE